jgi:hypothetical protein
MLRDSGWIERAALLLGSLALLVWPFLSPPAPSGGGLAAVEANVVADSASPYRWCELAEAQADAGRPRQAARTIRRALELGPGLPQIHMRAANLYFRLDDAQAAVRECARVLAIVPDYDAVVFGSFDRFGVPAIDALGSIRHDRRAMAAYLERLVAAGRMEDAAEAWRAGGGRDFASATLVSRYLDALLARRRYADAIALWRAYDRAGAAAPPDHLCNGDFEREPIPAAFDWRTPAAAPGVRVARDRRARSGAWSLRIDFPGDENLDYRGPFQDAVLAAGVYEVSAWVRAQEITTDQGPYLAVVRAEDGAPLLETAMIRGSSEWSEVRGRFRVALGPQLCRVQLRRHPSRKIDCKIGGGVWLDAVRLTGPLGGS